MNLDERTLPSNLQAERAVLGAVINRGDLWPEAAAVIDEAEFYRDAHRRVFKAMATMHATGVAIDIVTLTNALQASGELDECGGPAYVSAMMDGVPRSLNIAQYGAIVREKAQLRATIFAANRVLASAYEASESSGSVLDLGIQELLAIGAKTSRGEPVDVSTAVMEYAMSLDQSANQDVTPTGFSDLDDLLAGGLRPGELTIVAARPSVGKSSFGLQVALSMAQHDYPAVFFSLEMSTSALAARIVSWGARVDGHRLRTRMLGAHDYDKIGQACAALRDVPLLIQDATPSLVEITAACHRMTQRGPRLKCAVVDYMQLMVRKQGRSLQEEVAALSGGLKRIAKEEQIAVIALSQLSRAPEGRADKRPQLSDLRDSGALEQDADIAILLFREEMYKPNEDNMGMAEVILAKQRNGPTGVSPLAFISALARFENMAAGGT